MNYYLPRVWVVVPPPLVPVLPFPFSPRTFPPAAKANAVNDTKITNIIKIFFIFHPLLTK
jgi:hypothetical protein